MNRKFFIASVGKPGEGYDEDNLQRCIQYKCHAMHQNTAQKGAFNNVKKNSICFLKFKDNLIAYGEVVKTSTDANSQLGEWNWIIEVSEWIFYDKDGKQRGVSNNGVSHEILGGSQMATVKEVTPKYGLEKMKEIDTNSALYKKIATEIKAKDNTNNFIKLLESNKNVILTGAPGTGKTYLAKKIAEQMKAEYKFVQFHPSYDYTDFVEGLRPIEPDERGNIGFELKDGVFKEFCKRASIKETSNFDDIYEQFIEEVSQNSIDFETPILKKKFNVKIGKMKGCWAIPQTEKATEMSITKEMIRNYVENGIIMDWKPYTTGIGDYIKGKYKIDSKKVANKDKKYVFIIDEINRGEISKIFGELFFSIDPSYRGETGKVKTQYANMHSDEEDFYIPENVFVIGTMNDIDRSVESFDFAMRRRFTWIEITAKDSQIMFEGEEWKDEAIKRMNSLNNAISEIEGLNSSYHIGGAYFKNNLPKYESSKKWKKLWDFHLQPLLSEYLRGMPSRDESLIKLETAYNAK
jgi:hypothetical protein